ncbi:alpha-ketoglutarate-dependent dioxygenase AlkB [Corynebacterium aquatimens]|uniref:alpha-ketoglutarate-dependent dioxygenase AlkB n=1 Tax=Corynebacterium TaxID=1716 RepID=UPI001F1D58BA|nr:MULTISPECIES: alpha-ketoglutarate-dependent dioxygenase AlkB [Corynebacterium]QYH18961.1 alpha-ketoglutarate-dependent dioxygenase AlkB [Corynebacterium aquatimens]UIZ92206.1 alpha-ketoglutarate-dependent dioxygenase AlkB [Corynebacterium sp. CNCTC7651]
MLFGPASIPREPARIAPGVVHLPGFLSLEEQHDLVTQSRELAKQVAGTPVAMRRPRIGKGQMTTWMLSLGWFWATNPYRLVQEVQGHPVPPVPANYQDIADRVMSRAREIDPLVGPTPRVETALVNFYPPATGMGMHVDAEERSENAVVSLSIGEEAVFRIEVGGVNVDTLLMSGDALAFGGPARRARHGIMRVAPGTGPQGTSLADGRINITMRQVM